MSHTHTHTHTHTNTTTGAGAHTTHTHTHSHTYLAFRGSEPLFKLLPHVLPVLFTYPRTLKCQRLVLSLQLLHHVLQVRHLVSLLHGARVALRHRAPQPPRERRELCVRHVVEHCIIVVTIPLPFTTNLPLTVPTTPMQSVTGTQIIICFTTPNCVPYLA